MAAVKGDIMSTVVKGRDTAKTAIGNLRSRYLAKTSGLMIVVTDLNDGPNIEADPPHSHPHEQITYVASGEIEVFIRNETTHLIAGDLLTVPPNIPHAIRLLTDNVRLIDAFHPIREDLL